MSPAGPQPAARGVPLFVAASLDGETWRFSADLAAVDAAADSPAELFADADRDRVAACLERVRASGGSTVTASLQPTGGEPIPCEFVGRRLVDPTGEASLLVCVGWDLRVRREREAALTRSGDRLTAFAIAFPDVAFLADEDGRFIEVLAGGRVEHLLAEAPEALLGRTVEDVFPPDVARDLMSAVAETIEAGEVRTHEYRLELPGGPRWFEARIDALPFELGDRRAVVWVARDVTARRRERLAAARGRAILEAQQEAVPFGMLVVDEVGAIVSYNRRFLELWDIPEDVVESGDDAAALAYAAEQVADPEAFLESVEHLYAHPEETRNDEVALADGRVFERYTCPLVGETGTDYGRLWTFRDITKRRRREARLAELSEQLEVLNRVVRHDIRNDMTVVLGWAQRLAEHVDGEGEAQLERVIDASEHVVELTEIARDYVEALTDEGVGEPEPVALDAIVRRELELCRDAYPDASFVVDGELPGVAVAGTELLGAAVRNLLTNAVQHSDRETPQVTVSSGVEAGAVRLSVADDGPGIPDDQKPRVFGKGERGLESPGTGIGLYLVRTIVEDCGGAVWVGDNEPRGAVVTIELPVAD